MRAPDLRVAVLAAAALWSSVANGEDLEANLKSKLAQPFVSNADWATDYGNALARAKQEGKLVFAYFTRSYYP